MSDKCAPRSAEHKIALGIRYMLFRHSHDNPFFGTVSEIGIRVSDRTSST